MATGPHRSAFVALIAGAAAMGGFLFGFDTAVINGAVDALRLHFAVGPWTIGLAVSLALLGSAAGALTAGPLADRWGRRPVMLVTATLFAVSAIGSGLPFTIWDFIAWRLVGGAAVGAASVVAPGVHHRGRAGGAARAARQPAAARHRQRDLHRPAHQLGPGASRGVGQR